MAFEWFAPTSKSTQQQSDYRIEKATVVITETGIGKIPEGTTLVKLGYDSDRNAIAIAPTEAGDKTAFKLARRGRGTQYQITAKKLFERFALSPVTEPISGNFESEDGLIVASLAGNGAPARRRRRRKNVEVTAE